MQKKEITISKRREFPFARSSRWSWVILFLVIIVQFSMIRSILERPMWIDEFINFFKVWHSQDLAFPPYPLAEQLYLLPLHFFSAVEPGIAFMRMAGFLLFIVSLLVYYLRDTHAGKEAKIFGIAALLASTWILSYALVARPYIVGTAGLIILHACVHNRIIRIGAWILLLACPPFALFQLTYLFVKKKEFKTLWLPCTVFVLNLLPVLCTKFLMPELSAVLEEQRAFSPLPVSDLYHLTMPTDPIFLGLSMIFLIIVLEKPVRKNIDRQLLILYVLLVGGAWAAGLPVYLRYFLPWVVYFWLFIIPRSLQYWGYSVRKMAVFWLLVLLLPQLGSTSTRHWEALDIHRGSELSVLSQSLCQINLKADTTMQAVANFAYLLNGGWLMTRNCKVAASPPFWSHGLGKYLNRDLFHKFLVAEHLDSSATEIDVWPRILKMINKSHRDPLHTTSQRPSRITGSQDK